MAAQGSTTTPLSRASLGTNDAFPGYGLKVADGVPDNPTELLLLYLPPPPPVIVVCPKDVVFPSAWGEAPTKKAPWYPL